MLMPFFRDYNRELRAGIIPSRPLRCIGREKSFEVRHLYARRRPTHPRWSLESMALELS